MLTLPITIRWYDETRAIILAEFIGVWTWEDYHAASMQVVQMADTVDCCVDQILDFSQSSSIPTSEYMANIGQGINRATSKLELSVNVKPPNLIRSMLAVLEQTTPKPRRVIVQSREEALAVIEQHRSEDNKPP
jgi:hypothetical protein